MVWPKPLSSTVPHFWPFSLRAQGIRALQDHARRGSVRRGSTLHAKAKLGALGKQRSMADSMALLHAKKKLMGNHFKRRATVEMLKHKDASFLKSVPLFHSMTERQLHGLAEALRTEVVQNGHTIIGQGDESNGKFYIIAKGKVLVEKDAEHIATLSKGDFFGERALLSGGRRNSACIALKSVMLFTLDKEAFDRVKDFGQARSQILTRIMISIRPSIRMKFPRLHLIRY